MEPEYAAAFRRAFQDLAREHRVLFIPFLLSGVAANADLNLQDGIHPNPRGAGSRLRYRVESAPARARSDVHDSMIELRGVTKSVPSGTGILTILHPLDLTIPHGTVAAITGPSGSGKSTLLGLVAGLDAPTAGHDSASTASTSPRSARTRSPACAERASASSSSSFTCCRR